MQTTKAYMELLQERGKKGLPLERVYRQLFNKNLDLAAYGKIYRNAGALTPGVTDETPDGMSLKKIDTIIETLRKERYQWKPARRIYLLKKNGKKRPLGLPTWSDKLIAEVIRMILSAYFEPQFSDHSHGFRPGRGCHTALREIYYQWAGTSWFIEGDISACFDSLNHELLIETLSEHIHDGRFIHLMQKLLDAGYLEEWTFNQTLSGVPQGSIVSPVLSNILLDKLDKYVETVLIPQYTRGDRRKGNIEYKRLMRASAIARRKGEIAEAERLRKQAQQLPSTDTNDPHFRRLRFVRYADDFLLGLYVRYNQKRLYLTGIMYTLSSILIFFQEKRARLYIIIGPKNEAEEIKQQLGTFLQEELKLELSKTKTLITHARSEAAKFLGYEVTTMQRDTKRSPTTRAHGTKCRSVNGRVGLRVPKDILRNKCEQYMRKGKAVHRKELQNDSDFTIITKYQLEFRGIANYYRLAYNMHTLQRLKWVMEQSLTKTLAGKYKQSVHKIYKKYAADLEVDGVNYKGLRIIVPREEKKPLVAVWGGIPLK
jgi:group II intron reverse transcriptase/maturase